MNKPKGNNMPKMLNHNKSNHSKLNISSKSIQSTLNKHNTKLSSIPRSTSSITVADTNRKTSLPLSNPNNTAQRSDNKHIILSSSPAPNTDNAQTANTIAPLTNDDIFSNSQALITHTINTTSYNNTDKNKNFATTAAMEKIPSREQAIVFNSIDGVPQIEYILAIGKIVLPNNIKFVSRISNNRFCIFLSNKQILDNLMLTTKHININDHLIPIRRLINPAKRFIISNVCPSIPNQAIIDALRSIDITPISQINHLKSGIKIEGYEHIMSFRRQMFLNHEDVPKLPNLLLINVNENQFRIFFTDDQITCFVCSSVGHTTSNCRKNNEVKSKNDHLIDFNEIITHNTTAEALVEETPPTTSADEKVNSLQYPALPIHISLDDKPIDRAEITNPPVDILTLPTPPFPPNDKQTEPISEASLPLNSPSTTNLPTSPIATNKHTKKKAKISSRTSSFSNLDDISLENPLKPAEKIFINNNNLPLSLLQFQYVIENFSNNAINIHSLCQLVNADIPTLIDITEKVRPKISDRAIKSKLTKLANLLFKIANRASGGVAIFIHKNIESKEVTIQTHLETIATIVELDKQI
ncbi:hypothetical protein QTP88_019261 [Uroleucon formosanum]